MGILSNKQQGKEYVCLKCMNKEVIDLPSIANDVVVRRVLWNSESSRDCQVCANDKIPNKASFVLIF